MLLTSNILLLSASKVDRLLHKLYIQAISEYLKKRFCFIINLSTMFELLNSISVILCSS